MHKIRMIVVQPSSFCNINCRYCYVPNRQNKAKMEEGTIKKLAHRINESPLIDTEVEILWHAGEPLAVGIAYFENALNILSENCEKKLHHTIQTNGLLVNDKWIALFKKHNFGVGISIDGPEFLHDECRKTWNNKPTHKRVLQSYLKLAESNIDAGALCVLTRNSLKYPDEIFDFFVENNFKWVGFNVEEIENDNKTTSLSEIPVISHFENEYQIFIKRIFSLWSENQGKIEIREITDILNIVRDKYDNPAATRIPDETIPMKIVTIHKNGNVSTFSPELAGGESKRHNDFVIGNIESSSFQDMLNSDVLEAMSSEIFSGIKMCAKQCLFFDFCGGAYTSNRFYEHGRFDLSETTSCRFHRKTLTNVILQSIALPKS